jgi:hypothetical protein
MPEEVYNDHLTKCMAHIEVPTPPARFKLTCQDFDCILHKPVYYPDIGHAELIAWAHESRFREIGSKHFCDIEDLNPVQPSVNPESATGTKEAAHG